MGLNSHINTNFHAPRSFLDRLTSLQTRSHEPTPSGAIDPQPTHPWVTHSARSKAFHALKVTCMSPYPPTDISRNSNFKDTIQGLEAVQNRGNDILVRFCFKILCCNNFASTKNFKEVLAPTAVYRNLKPLNLSFEIIMKCGMGNLTSSSMMTTLP